MAEKAHIVIDQGSDFSKTLELINDDGDEMNVVGYTARGQIRKHYASSNSTPFSIELSNGSLIMTLTANTTANLRYGRYVYDLELVSPSNNVTRILEGIVTVTPEVTR